MKEIASKVYQVSGLQAGRVYAIIDDDGVTLIDAGLASAGAKILKQLSKNGYQPTDVKRILITHAHGDHVGALPMLKEVTGATVVASAIETPIVEGREPIHFPPKDSLSGMARLMNYEGKLLPGTPVDRQVNDDDFIPEVLGGLKVIATPGHTAGQIAFWQPERALLFCGDALMNLFGLRLPFAAFTLDMSQAIRSVQKLAMLSPKTIFFGHGNPLTENTNGRLRDLTRRVSSLI